MSEEKIVFDFLMVIVCLFTLIICLLRYKKHLINKKIKKIEQDYYNAIDSEAVIEFPGSFRIDELKEKKHQLTAKQKLLYGFVVVAAVGVLYLILKNRKR